MQANLRDKLVDEAMRVEEDALYSSKGHFAAASAWGKVHLWLGVPAAVLAAIAAASALSRFDSHNVVAGVLSLIVTALASASTYLNPSARSSAHHKAGNDYGALRNRARFFREIELVSCADSDALVRRLRELSEKRDELNKDCPQIPAWAFRRAWQGIEAGEAAYQVDSAGRSTGIEPPRDGGQ